MDKILKSITFEVFYYSMSNTDYFSIQILITFTKFASPYLNDRGKKQKSDILCSQTQYFCLSHVFGGDTNVINREATQ